MGGGVPDVPLGQRFMVPRGLVGAGRGLFGQARGGLAWLHRASQRPRAGAEGTPGKNGRAGFGSQPHHMQPGPLHVIAEVARICSPFLSLHPLLPALMISARIGANFNGQILFRASSMVR
ncbi:MAG: hypothetical protein AUJ49_05100 [Desulfovibrionaceae bacterium CG1_02_65_16]|nr:MAG: hypothetical protein AUJ49_05100 [Desulfovibrionaceae bacterium CG1_02_65_16]